MRTTRHALDSDVNDPVTLYRNLPWALISANRARPTIRLTPVRNAGGLNRRAPVILAPSPLVRSASAPPDYIPSPPASRQYRISRHNVWPILEDERQSFPVPPEVVETQRREKECSQRCMRCIVVATTLRWLLVSIALLGAACVVAGIVFGVMSSTVDKNTFFVLSFTFIGLGIVLVIVVCIGWRCAPEGHEPCHSLCRLDRTGTDDDGTPRAHQLMQRSRNPWYGGFLYPEFRYGTPPPSYSNAMEQYLQRMQRQNDDAGVSSIVGSSTLTSLGNISSLPSSPPPSYRASVSAARVHPSISGLVDLRPNTGDLPPPYRSPSRRSSVNLLDGVEETATTSSETVVVQPNPSTVPDESVVIIISEPHSQVEDSEVAEDSAAAVENMVDPEYSPAPPPNSPQEMPSVRSMVRRFEDLGRKLDGENKTMRFTENFDASDQPQINGHNLGISVSENYSADHNNTDEKYCEEFATEFQIVQSEQPTPASQENGFTLNKNEELSSPDVELNPINLPGVHDTCAVNDLSVVSVHNVASRQTSDELSDSRVTVDDAIYFASESSENVQFTFLQTVSGASNDEIQTRLRDFSRSQSLEDPEIGESGI